MASKAEEMDKAASQEAANSPEAISTKSVDTAEYNVYSQGKKPMLETPIRVTLLKDWGDNKEGDELELADQAVIAAGSELGLFNLPEEE